MNRLLLAIGVIALAIGLMISDAQIRQNARDISDLHNSLNTLSNTINER